MCRRNLHEINLIKDGFAKEPPSSPYNNTFNYEQTSTSTSSPSSSTSTDLNRISPALVMAMTILAAIFFLSGLLHLLIRYLTKKPPFSPPHHSTSSSSSSSSQQSHQPLQGQLQQLFHLHDSGLDQAFIDALPVFHYKDIITNMGSKEPFDCAVCLCEFSEQDKLRLLPPCSHAFHIYCIDTWLLSNSTCPLCRGTLLSSSSFHHPHTNPQLFRLDDIATSNNGDQIGSSSTGHDHGNGPEPHRVLSVRLGKLRGLKLNESEEEGRSSSGDDVKLEGESSRISSTIDGRRCYSLGRIHEYVENESNLMVALPVYDDENSVSGSSSGVEVEEGRKIRSGGNRKGESFSVSKIWLWSDKNKSRFAASAMDSPTASLPFRDTTT